MTSLLDPTHLIKATGYVGVFALVFLESGFIFGFFLPGDSLLFTAGLLASQHALNIVVLILLSIIGAILGNNLGYYTGAKLGHLLFRRDKSLFFSPKRVEEANHFFDSQGPKSLILARFIPAIRTFIPIVAGIGTMKYKTFLLFNAIGGTLWGLLLPILGYTLGRSIPNVDHYLLPIILLIVVISIIPALLHYRANKKRQASSSSTPKSS